MFLLSLRLPHNASNNKRVIQIFSVTFNGKKNFLSQFNKKIVLIKGTDRCKISLLLFFFLKFIRNKSYLEL